MVGYLMRKSTRNVLIVLVTVPSQQEAAKISEAVVNQKLAACVNILPPMTSIFRWQGKVRKSRETLLIIKTTGRRYPRLEEMICSMHSYEVPEIIALKVDKGLNQFIGWVEMETTPN